jgi:hypothetical protein
LSLDVSAHSLRFSLGKPNLTIFRHSHFFYEKALYVKINFYHFS